MPASKASPAWLDFATARSAEAFLYCGMKIGPGGAFGLLNGSSASQARNAGRYSGRNRRSNSFASASFPGAFSCSQNPNVLVS